MKNFVSQLHDNLFLPLCLTASFVLAAGSIPALAASARGLRVQAEVTSSSMSRLPGSVSPMVQTGREIGRLQGATRLEGITLYFSRTDAQKKDMEALIKAQGDKNSPLFHKWLTPEQFGARFGLANADIAKVQGWLESQGFQIDSVARGKDSIRFSGAASQVEAAFATELHRYNVTYAGKNENHFAASTALSVPSALAGVVLGVRNLDDFKPRSMVKLPNAETLARLANPQFTSGVSPHNNFLAPGDIATIYDVKPLTAATFTGIGQTIAIMGQSAVVLNDITSFQNAAGLSAKAPTVLLVPGTGASTLYSGDEGESDLDLEWSGAVAPGAQILFVYTGNSANNNGIFDSLQYTVDNKLAQIISMSYGVCEFDLGATDATLLETITSKAATFGQTVLAASGDAGSTACSNTSSTDTAAQQEQLNVSYPASSPYVTGVGGTTFNENGNTSTYWSSNGSTDVTTSALSYIPEVVWNDDFTPSGGNPGGLASTGGGVSTLFAKPTWQTGVTGIPTNATKRLVPDIALDSSNNHDPYIYCTSDSSSWSSGQSSSCTDGFRDSTSTGLLTVAGGTSFATPIFAGMLALVNDSQNYADGQGLVNPTLYTLAAVPATYSSAFHDITSGNNNCTAGSALCGATTGYAAGTGYDLTTGLGTVDANNLAAAWPTASPVLIGTTTTVSASNSAPDVNTNVTFAVAVASAFVSTVPSGTVTFTLDGTTGTIGGSSTAGTVLGTKTLDASGTASLIAQVATAGTHVVLVAYSGDATHGASTGVVSLTVGGTSSGSGTFTIAAGNITATRGSSGSSTVTVTPAGGYKGTVQFTVSTTSNDLNNACYTISNLAITGTTAATTTLSLNTNAASCLANGQLVKGKAQRIHAAGFGSGFSGPVTGAAVFVGLLMVGLIGRASRKLRHLRVLAGVILLATVGLAFTGCGGGGGSDSGSSTSNPPKGTYTLTLIGADSTTATITSSTTLTLTID